MLTPGSVAPDFTIPDQDGDDFTLSSLRGQTVVLYFYAKAGTPGCTKQACDLRDALDEYEAAGACIVGISRDPIEAIKEFSDENHIPFPLLSDEAHEIAETYGVWGEKMMFGNKFMGVRRSTFIIDPDGLIEHVIPKAAPSTHVDDALAALHTEAFDLEDAFADGGLDIADLAHTASLSEPVRFAPPGALVGA